MGAFIKGDVVVVPFPFSDLSASKRRPALVLADLNGDDVILCQITSQAIRDSYAIPLRETDFVHGGLRQMSNIRPNRLFTADSALILYRIGRISDATNEAVIAAILTILRA
ncbi:type II toxin-antitoxin system PemK/MazF family toxin [Candidatus Oscillochloris fontis]|uniref:type II toxin-antitoxin system PemK/MazF family toxin n=1 Tax=Candidatus Oscillochloris fontis TaxID=2496868 RepID=UPI00101C7506|nr:type II toxin-antitoxin system PemK/MazF family toxin [Candidatus Oscillochloris fontis]